MLICCYDGCERDVEPDREVVCGDSKVGCGRWYCPKHLRCLMALKKDYIQTTYPMLCPDCAAEYLVVKED